MNDRLYRSPTDRVIAGVAGGMAVWLDVDPSLVRIGWVLLAIFSGGIFALVYIAMMIIVPLPPPGWVPRRRPAADPGSWAGWTAGDPNAPGTAGGSSGPGTGDPASTGGQPAAGGWGSPPPAPGATAGSSPAWTAPPQSTPGWERRNGGRGAGIVLGAVLIVLGVWFLIGRYIHIDWSTIWPLVLVLLGIGLMLAAIRRTPSGGAS